MLQMHLHTQRVILITTRQIGISERPAQFSKKKIIEFTSTGPFQSHYGTVPAFKEMGLGK